MTGYEAARHFLGGGFKMRHEREEVVFDRMIFGKNEESVTKQLKSATGWDHNNTANKETPSASPWYPVNREASFTAASCLCCDWSVVLPSSAGNTIENVLAWDLHTFINPKRQGPALKALRQGSSNVKQHLRQRKGKKKREGIGAQTRFQFCLRKSFKAEANAAHPTEFPQRLFKAALEE